MYSLEAIDRFKLKLDLVQKIIYLARSEKFPEGLYILPTVSFFFLSSASFLMISRRQII